MKFKRAKKTKRNMGIYCHTFGFRAPYQVVCDGNFLQVARMTGKKLEEALPQFLGDECRLSKNKKIVEIFNILSIIHLL